MGVAQTVIAAPVLNEASVVGGFLLRALPSGVPMGFIDGVGAPEVMMILAVALVLFGGKKLPEFARGMGKAVREFKRATAGVEAELQRALHEVEQERPAAAPVEPPAPPRDATRNTHGG